MSAFPSGRRRRRIVEACLRAEMGPSMQIPADSIDLIETGLLDSMGWTSFVRAVESASGVPELGSLLTHFPATLSGIMEALQSSVPGHISKDRGVGDTEDLTAINPPTVIVSSFCKLGSRLVPSEEVDRAFGMPIGKLRERAGINSLAYAAEEEDELTLGTTAVQEALQYAECDATKIDWILATSETHSDYPSLAATLHSRLLARETCGALDVGGACLGLLNAFATAQGFIASGRARTIVIVSADVHSRLFTPDRVPGEFGGLFGDGSSAFVLRGEAGAAEFEGYRFGEFLFGCAGQYADAIRVRTSETSGLSVRFDGEALSRAAITRMEKLLADVELRSGISRSAVGGFATHQPNPRLVAILARQLGVATDKFPAIAQSAGNLGSSTLGAALHALIRNAFSEAQSSTPGPIFLASLGPGLLFGGGWLSPAASSGRPQGGNL